VRKSILSNPKDFNRLCTKLNKDFGCKEAFGCSISCPLFIAREVEFLANYKGMTIGEAYRATLHESIDIKDAKKIIKEAVIGPKQEYPDTGVTKDAK